MKKLIIITCLAIGLALAAFITYQVLKEDNTIGSVSTTGLLFKDAIDIEGFSDPDLDGVVCHITVTDKALSLDEQTDSSIACRQYKDKITGNYKENRANIFSSSKNLFFKTMRVDRFYDAKHDTLIYISYVKKMQGENASHSISTVPLFNAK